MPVLHFHSFRKGTTKYEASKSLRQRQTGQISIPLGNDAAQGYPFVEAIVSNTGLALRRKLLELADDGAGDEICSRGHLSCFCCPLNVELLRHITIFSLINEKVQALKLDSCV